MGAENFSEMCVRVRACIYCFLRCGHVRKVQTCACRCGPKNWGADGCAAHYENVCDVRAGANEKLRTLKVCFYAAL